MWVLQCCQQTEQMFETKQSSVGLGVERDGTPGPSSGKEGKSRCRMSMDLCFGDFRYLLSVLHSPSFFKTKHRFKVEEELPTGE